MTPQTERTSEYHKAVRGRTVAVVSCHPDGQVIEAVLGAVDHDVVMVEATAHAYSHIKNMRPDLVVVCMASDDFEGCQLLSMLTLDRETARIPVVTHVVPKEDAYSDCPNLVDDEVRPIVTSMMN